MYSPSYCRARTPRTGPWWASPAFARASGKRWASGKWPSRRWSAWPAKSPGTRPDPAKKTPTKRDISMGVCFLGNIWHVCDLNGGPWNTRQSMVWRGLFSVRLEKVVIFGSIESSGLGFNQTGWRWFTRVVDYQIKAHIKLTSNSGGLGSVGPNGGTVSSQYTASRYFLLRLVTTAKTSGKKWEIIKLF